MDRFRFTSFEGTQVRLDLNNPNGWKIREGLDLGTRGVSSVFLSQEGVDGATLATSSLEVSRMVIPVRMVPVAASTDALLALYQALITELRRETNTIELRPAGWTGASFFIDTFQAAEPHLVSADELPDLFQRLRMGGGIVLELDRQPKSRGAGDYL